MAHVHDTRHAHSDTIVTEDRSAAFLVAMIAAIIAIVFLIWFLGFSGVASRRNTGTPNREPAATTLPQENPGVGGEGTQQQPQP